MGWLQRLFSIGRLKREPPQQNAGRFLPPASVQRTHLGLAEVDPPAGVVTLRGGEVRAVVAVSGVPVHHRGQEAARAFLTGWAAAINAMPPDTAWLVRSRAGVVATYLREQRDQAAALAQREPGSALARLAADQLAHLRTMGDRGDLHRTDNFVAVRHPRGDVTALLQAAQAVQGHLRAAGLRAELLRDRQLAEAIAASWLPDVPELWSPQESGGWRLNVRGRAAHVAPAPPPRPETARGRRCHDEADAAQPVADRRRRPPGAAGSGHRGRHGQGARPPSPGVGARPAVAAGRGGPRVGGTPS